MGILYLNFEIMRIRHATQETRWDELAVGLTTAESKYNSKLLNFISFHYADVEY